MKPVRSSFTAYTRLRDDGDEGHDEAEAQSGFWSQEGSADRAARGGETPRGWQIGASATWLSRDGFGASSDFIGFLLVPRVKFMLKVGRYILDRYIPLHAQGAPPTRHVEPA